MQNIAILTSGGDSQGMNACINIIVKMAGFKNINVYGVMNGYQGLIEGKIIPLNYNMVRGISHTGGTVLKSARCEEFKTQAGIKKAIYNLETFNIEALIVIGGDGSFNGVKALNKKGIKTVAIPATIDNDLYYTENSLGFDSAVTQSASAIENIRQTMSALDRACVIEVMGRNCGSIALYSAAASNSEVVVTAEHKLSKEQIIDKVKYSIQKGIISPTVVVAEHTHNVNDLAKDIQKATGKETKSAVLGYIQRGGAPSVKDRVLAMQFGVKALELLENKKFDRAVGIKNGNVIDVSMDESLSAKSNFNQSLYKIFINLNS